MNVTSSAQPIRIAIIGAGQRGIAYARGIQALPNGTAIITAVVDPVASKRNRFGNAYIWGLEGRKATLQTQKKAFEDKIAMLQARQAASKSLPVESQQKG